MIMMKPYSFLLSARFLLFQMIFTAGDGKVDSQRNDRLLGLEVSQTDYKR
jgi:hypothetical protein